MIGFEPMHRSSTKHYGNHLFDWGLSATCPSGSLHTIVVSSGICILLLLW